MKPIIGITRCGKLEDYVASVEQAGGTPRVIDCTSSARDLIGVLDGVLLTGGGDVDPAFYGQERHEAVGDAEPGRDEFEIDLARRALDAGTPLLAICRGAQVLNIAAGGTLIQDIPSVLSGLPHAITEPKDAVAHEVTVTPGSTLEQALGAAVRDGHRCPVNSRHHQAVERLGKDLVTVALAPDGVIEGIERPGAPFCVGVQWHPENFWQTGEFTPLFSAFVATAQRSKTPSDST